MANQVIFGFIGSLLVCSIVLAVVVKNLAEGVAVSGKKPFIYGYLSAILTSVAAYLASFISTNPFEVYWFFGAIFFLFGIVHLLVFHDRFFYAHKHNNTRVLIAELLFGLSLIMFTVVVFSALKIYFNGRDFLFFPVLMSSLLFLVPLLVYHSFQAAYDIPAASFPTWQYPLYKLVESPDIDESGRVLIIGFEVAQRAQDSKKVYFRVRAPETWQLSTLFYHFINEYNDPDNKTTIEYIGKDDEPYRWWFYKKGNWYQMQQILNPEFSIRESGIRENTIIICERLLTTTPVSKNLQQKIS